MKKTSKILSIVMVFALLVTSMMISTVSVQAADETVILNWDFKTVDGDTVKDSSGYGNDGTIGDGVTVADGVAEFAAGNTGIELPWEIFNGSDDVTIEMTLTPAVFANYTTIMGVGELNGAWVVMGIMSDGAVRYAIATNGDDASESKGNSTTTSEGNAHATFQSEEFLTIGDEYTVKYEITQEETNVYIDGELALTVPTEDKDGISMLDGPVVLGKATKWGDPSFEGTMTSLKISVPSENAPAIDTPATDAPADPTEAPADPTEAPATEEPTETPEATTAKPTATATKAPSPSNSPAATDDGETPEGGINPVVIVVIVVVVVAIIAAVVVVMVKKKK